MEAILVREFTVCGLDSDKVQMGHIKWKGIFKHAQNAAIQIHPAHSQSIIQAFALHWYIL